MIVFILLSWNIFKKIYSSGSIVFTKIKIHIYFAFFPI